MTEPSRCKANRMDGSPCRAIPTASGYCFAHDPQLRAITTRARRRGGENRSKIRRAKKLVPPDFLALSRMLQSAMVLTYEGKLPPVRLTAIAAGAGALVKLHEVATLESRLTDLEARLERQTNQRRRA